MLTSVNKVVSEQVTATNVRFEKGILYVLLSDGREVSVPIDRVEWLEWLAKATAEQRENWSLEPGGYAIYWEELDDGIEVGHILAMEPLA
ncbi:MAG: DUF2442 domain-containing protein [Deltaproteobacteria bacterium]|nr:DUF2442 domain-containing protein [Deltaproteobacteria bacterium]